MMRTREEVRESLVQIETEIQRTEQQSRIIALYNRQQALLWVMGKPSDHADVVS